MKERFKRYLEREFRAIAPTLAAMEYREQMLKQLMDRAQELRIKGIDDEDLIFHIENSSPALPCSLDALSKPGFTTKENHSGLGLSTVAELLADCPYITVRTAFCDGRFQQTLTIHGNQENPK